ncbi:MAG TPA: DUF3108 domain-containing protein [Xanthobacteraceae bacterium]|nr:DUF3108 domain-containing protein [Xanthobacteraceae bacterium]
MQPTRTINAQTAVLAALCAAIGLFGCGTPVQAQGKLDATYTATLAGIPLGKGAWVIEVGDEQFTAAASGVTTGVLRVFSSGQGSGMSRGYVSNGTLIPTTYVANMKTEKWTEELRMTLAGGVIKDMSIDPLPPPQPDRVPVTDAHKRGVLDPMTASIVRVPGTGDMLGPDACSRGASVFDGRIRYDLKLAFKRIENVKADKGYAGPAVVCALYFTPIAGYIPKRPAVKYLSEQRDVETWLVPIPGTRLMAPFRTSLPTPLGTGALQANQFIVTAAPPRPTPTSIKGQ